MGGGDPAPRLQVEPAFRGSRRARVEPRNVIPLRAAEEEREPDRDLQAVPLGRGQRPGRVAGVPVRDRQVPSPARLGVGEEQVARPAGAHQRGLFHVGDVAVIGRDRCGAELAGFLGPRPIARLGLGGRGGREGRASGRGGGWCRGGGARGRRWGGRIGRAWLSRRGLYEPAQACAAARLRASGTTCLRASGTTCLRASGTTAHERAVSGTATRTPWLSVSSGSGSRCRAGSSRPWPARRTS